jgi:endonuclease III
METVLKGQTIEEMNHFLGNHGSNSRLFHSNQEAISQWMMALMPGEVEADNIPLEWIEEMLQHDRKLRPTARSLVNTVATSSCLSDPQVSFMGLCCMDDDEVENAIHTEENTPLGDMTSDGLSGSDHDASSWAEVDQAQTRAYFSPGITTSPRLISFSVARKGHTEKTKPTRNRAVRLMPQNKDKTTNARNVKVKLYRPIPGETPYQNHLHPTPEECKIVTELLTQADAHIIPSNIFPTPSATTPESGEVQPVLDAVIRTILSAHTSRTNYFRAYQGLIDRFGVLEGNIGKGSVNWNNVRNAEIKEVFDVIRCGGLATNKSKSIMETLELVHRKNLARQKVLQNGAELEDRSLSSQNRTPGEKADEFASAGDHGLSLEYLHELSSENALNELMRFPGIGLNSASIVLLWCLQRPVFPIDTHAFRLCKWLNWVPENANLATTYLHCEARVPNELKRPLAELFTKHGMNCPRCRTSSREGSKGWEKGCPIEHLVKRTDKDKGADSMNKGKRKSEAEPKAGKRRTD